MGETIFSKQIAEGYENISLRDYPSGVYFCTLQQGAMRAMKKLVIAR